MAQSVRQRAGRNANDAEAINNAADNRGFRRLTVTEHPEVIFTWGAEFPDKVKFRKRVTLWPLTLKLRADYDRSHRAFDYGCSCKDAVLRGRVRLDFQNQEVEYRKRLVIANGAQLGVTARCSYAPLTTGGHPNPSLGLQWEFGGGAAMWARDQIDVRQKLSLTTNLGLEACGSVQIPMPQAQYAIGATENRVSLGSGTFHLHVAQLNLIFNL